MSTSLKINGRTVSVDAESDTPLLWALRDTIGLKGTKFGCGAGICGACTVHIDGRAERSCLIPISNIGASEITTIEAIAADHDHPVVRAWIVEQAPQCGYCQSGQIMAATALLAANPRPDDNEIDRFMTNICRCGSYAEIRRAIRTAGEFISNNGGKDGGRK